jgi:hypothetical protein
MQLVLSNGPGKEFEECYRQDARRIIEENQKGREQERRRIHKIIQGGASRLMKDYILDQEKRSRSVGD